MREIKFRVWDEAERRMMSWEEIDEHDKMGVYQFLDMIEEDGFEVMQYTGNESYGYEGDILEWVEPSRGEHGDIMDYDHLRGVVEWDNERSGFIVRCANGNEWLYALMNITIIGNIYENPELLEATP